MLNYAMAISTYMEEPNFIKRFNIFKKSIESLIKTNFNGNIYLIDDCSFTDEHLNWVREKNDNRFRIIKKEQNSGISKIKNTGIKNMMLESTFEKGFLVDDDIEYIDINWHLNYFNVMKNTNIHHFTYAHPDFARKNITKHIINDIEIIQTGMINGCLLTITKQLIEFIGYFKVLPYKYGHEHTNFTVRSIWSKLTPFFCDAKNSDKWILGISEANEVKSMANIDNTQLNINGQFIYNSELKCECIE